MPAPENVRARTDDAGRWSPSHEDDLELARRALESREEALERFVQRMRCIPRVLALHNRRSGSPLAREDLEDLAQETFSTVWQRLDEYRGSARLETWVTRFCLLGYQNVLRRKGRRPQALEETALPDQRSTESHPLTRLHAALAKLESRAARTIEMRALDQLPFEEIAATFGEPVGTVKNRYYRGLERLRDILSRRGGLP